MAKKRKTNKKEKNKFVPSILPKAEIKKEEKLPKYVDFGNFDATAEIAFYYGFTPIDVPEIKKDDRDRAKNLSHGSDNDKNLVSAHDCVSPHLEEKVAIIRTFEEKKMFTWPQPVMLYFRGDQNTMKKHVTNEKIVGLDIVGTPRSIAEAVLIETAIVILREEGYPNVFVEINSIGDKDSMNRFMKEATNYYRKNIHLLSPHCREAFKKDVYEILNCDHEKCVTLREDAPKPMSFLSEPSRAHFAEVLEYLESLGIDYRINHSLVGNRNYCSQTIFEIKEAGENTGKCKTLAVGLRYDGLARRIGAKKEVSGVGITLQFKKKSGIKKKRAIKIKTPKIFFIQFGFEAKLKSLKIIEMLRKERLPICHALGRDRLVSQIAAAEKMRTPYVMIMGMKEAMEDSVIIRNMNTRSQETVPIKNLTGYIRKIK